MSKVIVHRYKMKGLTCANCTKQIIKTIEKWEGIEDVSFNFASQIMTLKAENEDDLTEKIQKKIDTLEEGVSVSNIVAGSDATIAEEASNKIDKSERYRLMRIIGGFIGLLVVLFLHNGHYMLEQHLSILGILIYIPVAFGVLKRAAINILRFKPFDENFLMGIATVGAIILGEIPEALAVIVFYELGEFLQEKAVDKSRKGIVELLDKKVEVSHLRTGETYTDINPQDLEEGDVILLKAGEMLACDSHLMSDTALFDTSSITGEHAAVKYSKDDEISAGFIALNSSYTLMVNKKYEDSTVKKIMNLTLESAGRKAKTERVVSRFASYYTPAVVFAALALAIFTPMLTGDPQSVWTYRALVFLVISCPCAIVLSIPLSFFAAVGRLSKDGILLKGANFIEAIHRAKSVVFDKTGTITEGNFKVLGVESCSDYSEKDILIIAKNLEEHSSHPIATAIIEHTKSTYNNTSTAKINTDFNIEKIKNSKVEEQAGKGLAIKIDNSDLRLGKKSFCSEKDHTFNLENQAAGTAIYLSVNGNLKGMILLGDKIKNGVKEMSAYLKSREIHTSILSGDNKKHVQEVSKMIGIDSFEAELLPQDKLSILEDKILESDGNLIYVGDGVNDAPVLARADIGIAMGTKGSDIAVETSDVVIINDDTSLINRLFYISDKTMSIVWQNITFALVVKLVFFTLSILGMSSMWFAVFADVGVSLLTVVNSLRLLKA